MVVVLLLLVVLVVVVVVLVVVVVVVVLLGYSFSGVVKSRGTRGEVLGYCRPRNLKQAFSGRKQTLDPFMVTVEFALRNQYR